MSSPYQIQDSDLTEAQRYHLHNHLFPTLLRMKRKIMQRKAELARKASKVGCDNSQTISRDGAVPPGHPGTFSNDEVTDV